MWNLLKKRQTVCDEFQKRLEDAASAVPRVTEMADLLAAVPAEQRVHATVCKDCRDATAELLTARALLKDMPAHAGLAGPWFASRVMAAIAERESKLRRAESTWVAVPRLASRLTWVSAALLLAASTWLYERPLSHTSKPAATEATQETLFDNSQPPASQDDVLVSLLEKQQ